MPHYGEVFRELGDELKALTNGEHYFSGVQEHPTMYLFSFGSYYSAVAAMSELRARLQRAQADKDAANNQEAL